MAKNIVNSEFIRISLFRLIAIRIAGVSHSDSIEVYTKTVISRLGFKNSPVFLMVLRNLKRDKGGQKMSGNLYATLLLQ